MSGGSNARGADRPSTAADRPPSLRPVGSAIAGDIPAGAWRRLMSCAYEGVLLFGVVFFFGYAFTAVTHFDGQSPGMRWAFQAWMVIVLGAYFGWFWSEGRRTLPMKTISLRLVRADGASVSIGRALFRYACALVVSLVLPLGAAVGVAPWAGLLALAITPACVLLDRRHRAPWDVLAATVMLHRREQREDP